MRRFLLLLPVLACGNTEEMPAVADTATLADVPVQPPLTSADVAAPGPYAAATFDITLTDTIRSIPATETFPGAEHREVSVGVWYPAVGPAGGDAAAEAPVGQGGPFPVLVYSHGFLSGKGENAPLLRWLATHGILVVAPTFPRTNANAQGGADISDVVNQPGDISLALNWLEAAHQDASHRLHGVVDTTRVVAAGMSLGGLTSALVGFYPTLHDKRVTAVASMAGALCLLPASAYPKDGRPLYLLYGRSDVIAPYEANGVKAYTAAAAPKWLATIEGGTHLGFAAAAADLFAGVADPDAIGCASLTKALAGKALGDIAADLGFGPDDIDTSCPEPCTPPAANAPMSTADQAALLPVTLGAFVRYAVTREPRLAEFLSKTVAEEYGEVTVQSE